METIIRFAPLIRVSTESQKMKGESLRTQSTQIKQYVSLLHGVIPDNCIKYSGQEHATPNQERALLDQLLADAPKNLFDAVIVTDASRWSRDNLKSEAGLNILAENDIRFFVSCMEYDLHNPEHRFILTMSTSINQLQATKQSINSINNRIERAKRNVNSAGRLPYGRTFDRKTETWGIDPVKKHIIEQAAKRYLNGEGLLQIAATIKMNASNLHRILTKSSGTIKTTNFKYKRINETINFIIPPLLDESTIKAIHEQIYVNKCFRGNIKNKYLLVGFIYCSKCGLKMKSHTNERGKQYYVHSRYSKTCEFHKFVLANEIENSVLIELIKTFGDHDLMEKAIKRASPDMEKVEGLIKEKTDINIQLKKIATQKNNIIDKIGEGLLSNDEIKQTMNKLRSNEESYNKRLLILENQLSSIPNPQDIKRISQWTGKVLFDMSKDDPQLIFKKSFEWKRKLIEKAFSGTNVIGKPFGIYISLVNDKFQYELIGTFKSNNIGSNMRSIAINKASTSYTCPAEDTCSCIKGEFLKSKES